MELLEMGSSSDSNKMRDLYEASLRGDIATLNSLIQQNPLILFKISTTSFKETPLHISSLLGHLEFTRALLNYNPKLSIELDSSRCTALHLASAQGHIHIVKELLQVYDEACLVRDEEGKIPLHYAAMRGRNEVVRELVEAKHEALNYRVNGETVFHLSVKYNHLETLQVLVELELAVTGDLVNFTSFDDSGNNVLQLAIMLKRHEVHILLIMGYDDYVFFKMSFHSKFILPQVFFIHCGLRYIKSEQFVLLQIRVYNNFQLSI